MQGVLITFLSVAFAFEMQTAHSYGPAQVARPQAGRVVPVAPLLSPQRPALRLKNDTPRVSFLVFVRGKMPQRVVRLVRSWLTRLCFYRQPCAGEPVHNLVIQGTTGMIAHIGTFANKTRGCGRFIPRLESGG